MCAPYVVRHRTAQLPDRRQPILPHSGETLLHPHVPPHPPSARAHGPRLDGVDDLDHPGQRRSLRARRRRADLRISRLHRRESIRQLVHVRYCRRFLAVRRVARSRQGPWSWRVWVERVEGEPVQDVDQFCDFSGRSVHLCCRYASPKFAPAPCPLPPFSPTQRYRADIGTLTNTFNTGTYVSIKLIIDAYNSGSVGAPFAC